MTNTLTLRSLDIPSIHKFGVGFDNLFDDLLNRTTQSTNYPPYNIVKHSEDTFSIELAVAGFRDGEVTITTERNQLTVKGEQVSDLQVSDLDETKEYLHKGISARSFVRTWTLADHVEVTGAKSENGILTISLERKVPEEQKPKSIAINYTK
jgi:molecular chaperone IbpA